MDNVNVSGSQAAIAGIHIRRSRRESLLRLFKRLSADRLAFIALIFFVAVVALAILAPVLFPNFDIGSLDARLKAPVWAGGTWAHAFGTDEQGKDLLAQMVWGARVTLRVGIIVVLVAGVVGIALGLIAGLLGGTVDNLIMRSVDIMFAMPALLIALVFVLVLGSGERNLIIALTINAWMVFVRLVRGQVVSMRDGPMVEAARAVGVPPIRIMVRHILPNILSLVVTISVLEVARIMLAEATMSFLGYGIQPPSVSWGVLIGNGRSYVSTNPWFVILPGVALAATVLSLNIVANWLRTEVDPLHQKTRQIN